MQWERPDRNQSMALHLRFHLVSLWKCDMVCKVHFILSLRLRHQSASSQEPLRLNPPADRLLGHADPLDIYWPIKEGIPQFSYCFYEFLVGPQFSALGRTVSKGHGSVTDGLWCCGMEHWSGEWAAWEIAPLIADKDLPSPPPAA